jgi:hypothetical protein
LNIIPPISKSNQDTKTPPVLNEENKDGKEITEVPKQKYQFFFLCTLNTTQYVSLARYLAIPFLPP